MLTFFFKGNIQKNKVVPYQIFSFIHLSFFTACGSLFYLWLSVSALPSPVVWAANTDFGRGPFGKEPCTPLNVYSLCNLSIYNFNYFSFWFSGQAFGSACTYS